MLAFVKTKWTVVIFYNLNYNEIVLFKNVKVLKIPNSKYGLNKKLK